MNAWFARLLGGAACTLGALALGAGAAQADTRHDGLDLGIVTISTSHSSAKASSGTKSAPKKQHRDTGVQVRLNTPVKVRADVSLGSTRSHRTEAGHQGSGGTRTSSASTPRRDLRVADVRVGSGSSTPTARQVQVRAALRAERAQEARQEKARAAKAAKAARAKAAKARAQAVKAAEQAADRQRGIAVGAGATLLPSLVPATRVTADARVLDLPVSACVLVNAGGCSDTGSSTGSGDQPSTGGGQPSTGGPGSSGSSTPVPAPLVSAVVTATADAPVVGDVDACVLVNALGCTSDGSDGSGTGSGSGTGTGTAPGSDPVTGTDGTLPVVLPPVVVQAGADVPVVGDVDACVTVNASACEDGAAGTVPVLLPPVVVDAGADLPVVGDVDACVTVNAAGCDDGGAVTVPVVPLPPVVVDTGVDVPGVGDVDACVTVDAPGCAGPGAVDPTDPTDPADPTDPTDPAGPTTPATPGTGTGDGNGGGGGNGVGNGDGLTTFGGPGSAPVPAGAGSHDQHLAHTGAPAGLAGLLAAALLLMLLGGGLVPRPRSGRR